MSPPKMKMIWCKNILEALLAGAKALRRPRPLSVGLGRAEADDGQEAGSSSGLSLPAEALGKGSRCSHPQGHQNPGRAQGATQGLLA